MKNLPPDIRAKLRENLLQAQEQQQQQQQQQHSNPYQAPPMGQYQPQQPQFVPAPPPRTDQLNKINNRPVVQSKPESKSSGNSVSWHEWTQQLQAYIAWVNSQLRKRPELRPVQDLRTDLQSGEVLAQLIEIICK